MQQVGARGGTPGDGAEVVQADASAPAEFARAEALLSVADGKAHARKAKPLRETAWLYIESEPSNAQILVDGTPKGQGRAFVNSSGSRLREVVVSGPGYETVDGFIELEEREVTKLLVSLQPIGGRVTGLTDPWGATVAIDDLDRGRTPITLRALIPGMHRLALSSGSWSWAGNVNVSKGETRLISMSMGTAMAQAAPLPTPPPGPVVQPAPTPQLRAVAVASPPSLSGVAPTAGKPKCAPICDRFVQSVPGSGSLREPIRNRCMERCDAGDQRFSICAWKSATMDDVKTCADLPEQQ